jgi:transposase-like protein
MPPLERKIKVLELSLDPARWLEQEAERIGISEAELIRQAIERFISGPPAVLREERFLPERQSVAEYLERGVRLPPSEDVVKRVRVDGHQVLWLRAESRRLGIAQKELLRQAVDRFRSGPPAKLPSNPRSLWRRRDWLYTITASRSLEMEWERYRAEHANS